MLNFKGAVVLTALFVFAACAPGTVTVSADPPVIVLNTDKPRATVDVVNVPAEQLSTLRAIDSREAWQAILPIAVAANQPPMLGDYRIERDRIVFTPMFPLDPGRQYHVKFMPPGAGSLTAIVGLPAVHTIPSTVVAQVFPSGDAIPENQLRLYIHFSAPMGMKGGLEYVHLLDDQGKEVKDPFLPLDAEFWNDDRTRYTVFFDPGRQKRGIPVIEEMGRSLTEGQSYTLVVDAAWRDGNGLPLKEPYRRTFRIGPPDERPLDHTAWSIQPPAAGTRDPLTVAFPEPLDRGLLLRAMGVQGPGPAPIFGEIAITDAERAWSFTPREAWRAGTYQLIVLGILEDLAGNRIGRAFEVDQFDRSDQSSEPEKTLIPFLVR
jgi:hypothetical protein